MTGARALLTMLRSAGVDRLFGNPGTTELPLLDELVSFEGITYHLALQEGVAVGMADGYAQATGRVGVLSLHTTGGLANAVGLLYDAARAGTPLLALSGQQDTRLILQEPFLYSDMVRWVRPLVKWAYEVVHPADLPRALRRALSAACAPPSGPVFLSVPLDVLQARDAPVEDVAPHLALASPPDPAGLSEAVDLLRAAHAPLIVAGDRVARDGAELELLALAEATGWPVALEPFPTRYIFPTRHPQALGPLPRFPGAVRARLAPHDVVLVVGLTPFEHFLYDGGDALPEGTRLVHLDIAPEYIGRHHVVALGVPGDLRAALMALRRSLAVASVGDAGEARSDARDRHAAASGRSGDPSQRPYEAVTDVIASVLLDDDVLVEEAISARTVVLDRIPRTRPGTLFGAKGGTIGWGLPAALGIKLAQPDRRVLAIVGDGSLLMEMQGLWTASQYGIGAVVVVLDNGGYAILKQGLATLAGQAARSGRYPATDVRGVDLVGAARAFGVAAERIDAGAAGGAWAGELRTLLGRALDSGRPYLIGVALDVPVRPLA
jgi:benzoylformate decarboxylase